MTFGDSVVGGFKNCFDFYGRATRSEFWWFMLFSAAVRLLALTVPPLFPLVLLIFFFPEVSLAVRRLHDTRRSGWNYLWIATIVGAIPVVIWFCEPTKRTKAQGVLEASAQGDVAPEKVAAAMDRLEQLVRLKDRGALTEDEFAAQKALVMKATA